MKVFSKTPWKTIFLGSVIFVLPVLLMATGCGSATPNSNESVTQQTQSAQGPYTTEQATQKYVEDFMGQATSAFYQAKCYPVLPQDIAGGFPKPLFESAASSWEANLHTIVATPWHSASEWPYFAYFFVNGNLVGDAFFEAPPTAIASQDDSTITVTYDFYKTSDAGCCPSGKATERFHWDGSKLVMLDQFQKGTYFDPKSNSTFMPLTPVNQ